MTADPYSTAAAALATADVVVFAARTVDGSGE